MNYRGSGFGKIIKDTTTIWFNDKFVVEKSISPEIQSFGQLNDYKNIKKGDRWEFRVTIPFPTQTEHYELSSLNDGESVVFYEHADKDFSYSYYAFYFYDEIANIGYLNLTARELDKPEDYSIPLPIEYTKPEADYSSGALNGKPKIVINSYDFTDMATNLSINVEPIIKAEGEQRSGYLKRVYKIADGRLAVKGSIKLRINFPSETEYMTLASIDNSNQNITLTENGNIYTCYINIHDNYDTVFTKGYISLELPIIAMQTPNFIVNPPVITQNGTQITMAQDQGADIRWEKPGMDKYLYYKFYENSPSTFIEDTTGVYNAVSSVNTDTISINGVNGGSNKAFEFSGNYITQSSFPDITEDFTVSCWIKFYGSFDKYYNVISKGGVFPSGSNFALTTRWRGANNMREVRIGTTSNSGVITGFSVYVSVSELLDWTHVFVTIKSDGSVEIFLDNVLQGVGTIGTRGTLNYPLTIGRWSVQTNPNDIAFNGDIAYPAIYKGIPTESERTKIYSDEKLEIPQISGGTPDPTESSPLYTQPLQIGTDVQVGDLIKAKAFLNGVSSETVEHIVRHPYPTWGVLGMQEIQLPVPFPTWGAIAMEEIDISLPMPLANPVITFPDNPDDWSDILFSISSPDGGSIYFEYGVNGATPNDPTINSTEFTTTVNTGSNEVFVKAIAYKDGIYSMIEQQSFRVM